MRRQAPTVVVVSRFPVVRAGLSTLLSATSSGRLRVLEGPPRGRDPDVVVHDLDGIDDRPTDLGALAATSAVVGLQPAGRPDLAQLALDLGAVAVVPFTVEGAELLEVVERLVGLGTATEVVQDRLGLSGREKEILRLIARGRTNPEIADQLYLSINSVKSYIRSAYAKLGVTRRSEAVRWAVESGLIDR